MEQDIRYLVCADFVKGRSMPPSGDDLRELGVVVLSAALNPK